jgi:hypothetical protein
MDTSEENRNLLVFVTATVLSERGESMYAVGEGFQAVPPRDADPTAPP